MSIANNKKAFHDFFIEDQLEAGLVLEGWEVKAIRAGRVQLKESYIYWKKDAFYLARHTSNPTPSVRASFCSSNPKSTSSSVKPSARVIPLCR